MLKKAMPLVLMTGLVLGGCGTNNAVPNKNETPMQDVEDRAREWTPNVHENRQTGPNLDGLDNGQDLNRNGTRNGVIDNGTGNEGTMNDGTTNVPNNDTMTEENPKGNINNR